MVKHTFEILSCQNRKIYMSESVCQNPFPNMVYAKVTWSLSSRSRSRNEKILEFIHNAIKWKVVVWCLSLLLKFIQPSQILVHCTKMKLSIKDFFSKCEQIRRKLWIWSHLLKKSLIENFMFMHWFLRRFTYYSQRV